MKKVSSLFLVLITLWVSVTTVYADKESYIGDIELKQVKMQDAVRILSELSGRNVIVTKDAAGVEFSLFVRNASLTDAIDSMCRVTGLWYRKDSDTNVYIVMTAEQFKEDVLVYRNESTKVFTLKHQNVVSAANAIKALFGNRVFLQTPINDGSYEFDGDMNTSSGASQNNSNRGNRNNRTNRQGSGNLTSDQALAGGAQGITSDLTVNRLQQLGGKTVLNESDVGGLVQAAPIRVTYNSLHNLLLVRSSDEKALGDVEQLIKQIDQPAKQVLLQMKIMRVALGENEDSVFDFQYTSSNTVSGPSSGSVGNPLTGNGSTIPGNVLGLGMKPDQLATGSLVFQIANDNWLAKLAFLESENRTKLISTPLIMASNNKEAEIFIGEERPLIENVSSEGGNIVDGILQPLVVTTETNKKEVGTTLKIWPRINSDATVTLDIEQEISQINLGAATIPVATGGSNLEEYSIDTVTTTKLNLTAVAKHSQTIAIGGLIEESSSDDSRQIPGISSVPILGDLLSSDEKEFSRSELVILIKPYIYDSVDLTGDGLERVNQELTLAENKDMIEDEARKSNNYSPVTTTQSLNQFQAVAKNLKKLLQTPELFEKGLGVDWKVDGFTVTSLGSRKVDGLFYTRVVVNNEFRIPQFIDDKSLGDYWYGLAWVFERGEEDAEIDGFGARSAVLISTQPIEKVLSDRKIPMRYVLASGE